MENESVDELIQALSSDKLITLKIGNNPETSFSVQIQQKVLKLASTWFRNALKEDKERQTNVITLTEEDSNTWKIALFWIINRKIPENDFFRNVECWLLGHQYGMPHFQDQVMLQLLEDDDVRHGRFYGLIDFSQKYQDLVSAIPSDSALMRFLAEQAARDWDWDKPRYHAIIAELKRDAGFLMYYEKAEQELKLDEGHLDFPLVGFEEDVREDRRAQWRDYMVGELPVFMQYI
ncbi:hypothetical protein CKM354_000486400 [Cercospora kikuchii]|uniref:BTB domain-containing protein n=1 Tax=Cercospora kikuchii TaxID=84275 RepID=A0A9P3FG71_9PEZI|nr:uncharacterized protein CKM354_000486400 [Cercospora kikuchii]GIZ41564.1 hypothetical protein CKM354_000486400 [Cercospora kikuchii]